MSSKVVSRFAKPSFKDRLKSKKAQLISSPKEILQFGQIGCEFMGMPTAKVVDVSRNCKKDLGDMIKTAEKHKLGALASPQINYGIKAFVMNELVKQKEYKGKWFDETYQQDNFKTYLNPKILEIKDLEGEWETNPTFPLVKVNAKRYKTIGVGYYNEKMEYIEEELTDFPARVFQHHLEILYGKDFMDWRVNFGDIEPIADESYSQFPKFFKVISEFSHKVKQIQEDFPDLFQGPTVVDMNRPLRDSAKTSWEDDTNKRLLKNIRKDLRKILGETEEEMKKSSRQFANFDVDHVEEEPQKN